MGNASRLRQQRKQDKALNTHIQSVGLLKPGLYTQVQVYKMIERAIIARDHNWLAAIEYEYGKDIVEKLRVRMNER